jgi:hypothetical protein
VMGLRFLRRGMGTGLREGLRIGPWVAVALAGS